MALVGEYLDRAWESMVSFLEVEGLPRAEIVSIVVILVVGFVGGHIASEVVRRILKKTSLDDLAVKANIQALLRYLDYSGALSDLLAAIVRYMIYVLVVFAVFNVLGVQFLLGYMEVVVGFAPRLVVALVVVFVGFVISNHLQHITVTFFRAGPMSSFVDEAEAAYPAYRIVGQFVKLIGYVASMLAAFAILGVDRVAITILMALFGIGVVTIFVLASWGIMKNVAVSVYFQMSKTFAAGQWIEVGEYEGEIKHVTPLYVKIKGADGSYYIPNTHFLNHVVEHET